MNNNVGKNRIYRFDKTNQVIVLLFSILPIIDSLNGIFKDYPIGIVYKFFLCLIVFCIACRDKKFIKKYIVIILAVTGYVFFSVFINICLGNKVIKTDFLVKLLFNVVLLSLLFMCLKKRIIAPISIYTILDYSSWVFIFCFLIPYTLKVGNAVYSGEMGYKALFISQNELNLIIAVMAFFSSYKLTNKVKVTDVVKLLLIVLIGMLLNTKSAIISSIIAVLLWVVPIILKANIKLKALSVAMFIAGFVALRKNILSAISSSWNRYISLTTKHYDGAQLAGILSGRNYFLDKAIREFKNGNQIIRFIFGNGFCSNTLIEMDLLDIFFYLGIIGFSAAVIFLFKILRKTYQNGKTDKNASRFISLLIIVFMLFFSGHVLFMSMSGCYFVLYICFLAHYHNDNPYFGKIYDRIWSKYLIIRYRNKKRHRATTVSD